MCSTIILRFSPFYKSIYGHLLADDKHISMNKYKKKIENITACNYGVFLTSILLNRLQK